MSFMHLGSIAAASASQVIVELQNILCFHVGLVAASGLITTKSTGQVTCTTGGLENAAFNWIDPITSAPGSPVYEIMRGVSSDDEPTGPSAGVWTPVTSNPAWGLSCTTTLFGPIIIEYAQFTVSIRQGTGPVIDTATWTIDIECLTLN